MPCARSPASHRRSDGPVRSRATARDGSFGEATRRAGRYQRVGGNEGPMTHRVDRVGRLHKAVRRLHRWLSIAFTVAVLANLAVLGHEEVGVWVGIATLFP